MCAHAHGREASKALQKMPMLLVTPFVTLIVVAGTLIALFYGFLYIFTAEDREVDANTGIVTYDTDDTLFYMKWYYILGQFIKECFRFTFQ